jgi:hypothetical protein
MVRSLSQRTRPAGAALSLLLLAGLAACEQGTGPDLGSELDSQATLADYKAMQDVFASSGWAGLQALSGRTPMASSAVVNSLGGMPGLAKPGSGRDFAVGFFRELTAARSSGSPFARTVISTVHLGKTLVYDPVVDWYVIDPKRTGAPTNGTRFIVYEVDDNKRPIVAKETGHADLLDEGASTGNAIVLRLVLVERGKTVIDYRTSADLRGDVGEIGVQGYAQDAEGTKLSFTIDVAARKVGSETRIDADFELGVTPRSFTAIGSVRGVGEGEGGGGEITLTLRHESNTLRVDLAENDGEFDGVIQLNGKTFVIVTGDSKAPTLRGPAGKPLSALELQVVVAIVKMSDDVFDLVEELVKPVEKLLILGWVL